MLPSSTTTAGGGSSTTVWWSTCQWCGCIHGLGGICPRVREIEYYPDGTIKRVEFHAPQPVVPQITINQAPKIDWVPPLTIRLAKDTKPECSEDV